MDARSRPAIYHSDQAGSQSVSQLVGHNLYPKNTKPHHILYRYLPPFNKDHSSHSSSAKRALVQLRSLFCVRVLDNQICLMMRNNRTMTTVSELKVGLPQNLCHETFIRNITQLHKALLPSPLLARILCSLIILMGRHPVTIITKSFVVDHLYSLLHSRPIIIIIPGRPGRAQKTIPSLYSTCIVTSSRMCICPDTNSRRVESEQIDPNN